MKQHSESDYIRVVLGVAEMTPFNVAYRTL